MLRKAIKTTFLVSLSLSLMVLASSCGNNPAGTETDHTADIAAIKQSIQQDDDMFNVNGFDDNGAQSPSYNSDDLGKQIGALKYGRRGKFELESIEIVFDTDTTATATIIHTLNGEFVILAVDTTDTSVVIKPISKPMTNTITRKAKLQKVNDTGNELVDWRITQVSMAVAQSDDPTIDILEMRIDLPDTLPDIVITDPLNTFMNRHEGIPTLSRGDTIKVFVTLTNTNEFPPEPGETVTLRHRMNRFRHSRKVFNDSGEYPDETANDGVFSAFFVIGHRMGIHHAALDVIDNGTIFDDTAPYDAVIWASPYKVRL
ncbi:MAG: hypothetical protein ACE5HO_02035 [bacterium]